MEIPRDWFRLYESVLDYVKEEGIEIVETSSGFTANKGSPRVIRKSVICLRANDSSLPLEEIEANLPAIQQCSHVTARKHDMGGHLSEVIHCYSLRAMNPNKYPVFNSSRKSDPEYIGLFMKTVAAWRRQNISLIEEVKLYYSS